MAATPVVNNCEQNLPNENSDLKLSSGNISLKNGTDMEEGNSEDIPDNIGGMNNKVKSPNQGREAVTMENFQDGDPNPQHNQTNLNSAEQPSGNYGHGLDSYSQNTSDSNLRGEDYGGKMNDNLSHSSVSPYGGGGYANHRAAAGNYMSEQPQHGGAQMPGNVDLSSNSQSNAVYNQFNPQNMRSGYQQPTKPISMVPGRPPNSGNMAMMQPSYSAPNPAAQQRLLGGPISQHGGPTPTLNQLLQSPNPVQRYQTHQNNYSEYSLSHQSGGQKGLPPPPPVSSTSDLGSPSSQPYPVQNWGSPRGMGVYSQQYRNQVTMTVIYICNILPCLRYICIGTIIPRLDLNHALSPNGIV